MPNECEAEEVERESLPSARRKIPASPAKTSRKCGDFCILFLHFRK